MGGVRGSYDYVEGYKKAAEEFKKSLRDEFAMAALGALVAKSFSCRDGVTYYPEIAYQYADAMLEAREQGAENERN